MSDLSEFRGLSRRLQGSTGRRLGVVTMKDGRVTGRDTQVAYDGTYREDGDEFWVSLKTKRYAPGRLPLFQIDELDISARAVAASVTRSEVPWSPSSPFWRKR